MKSQLYIAVIAVSLLSACGKIKNPNEAGTKSADSELTVAESAISSVNTAADEAEQAEVGECNLSRFAPLLGSASCVGTENDSTVTVNYGGCNVSTAIITGSVKLSFDSPATCSSWINGGSLPTSGSAVATSADSKVTFANGYYIDVNSNQHYNYLGQSIQGGARATFGANNTRQIDILGFHRVLREPSHNLRIFDHSITTTSPIVVSGFKSNGTRQVSSGSVRVFHNIAEFTTDVTYTDLQWSTMCCHPVDGQVEYQLTGNFNGNYKVDFSTGVCNQVRVTKNGGAPELKSIQLCK